MSELEQTRKQLEGLVTVAFERHYAHALYLSDNRQLQKRLFAVLDGAGFKEPREDRIQLLRLVTGDHSLSSSDDLPADVAKAVIDFLPSFSPDTSRAAKVFRGLLNGTLALWGGAPMDGQPTLEGMVADGAITKGAVAEAAPENIEPGGDEPPAELEEVNEMTEVQEGYEVPQGAYQIHTITGLSWDEVRETMQGQLPDGAYKQADKSFLTDTNPAYLTEALDRCFGPCGYGWWLDIPEPPIVSLSTRHRKDSSEVWEASIDQAWLRYRLVVNGAEVIAAVPTSGGNINEERGYAVKGVMTNAIGSAASKLLWQLAVRKGEISHRGKQKGKGGSDGGGKLASKSQADFVVSLLDQLGVAPAARDATIKAKGFPVLAELGGKQASELIGRLKAAVETRQEETELPY